MHRDEVDDIRSGQGIGPTDVPSRRISMIVAQEPAQALATLQRSLAAASIVTVRNRLARMPWCIELLQGAQIAAAVNALFEQSRVVCRILRHKPGSLAVSILEHRQVCGALTCFAFAGRCNRTVAGVGNVRNNQTDPMERAHQKMLGLGP